jgi:large subunit ribosomal protein L18
MKKIRRKKRMVGTADRPRLVVYRSLKHIYGQLIDDGSQKVLLSASNITKDLKTQVGKAKNKTEASFIIGKSLGEAAGKKKIKNVIFDRNGYLYHGRVKAFADGAREGGLNF